MRNFEVLEESKTNTNDDYIDRTSRKNQNNTDLEISPAMKDHKKEFPLLNVCKYKQCFLSCNFILALSIFLLINYLHTNSEFDKNKTVRLLPLENCSNYIDEYKSCMEKGDLVCTKENHNVLTCYDNIHDFNLKCGIYLSEAKLCRDIYPLGDARNNSNHDLKENDLNNQSGDKTENHNDRCYYIIEDLKICNTFRFVDLSFLYSN